MKVEAASMNEYRIMVSMSELRLINNCINDAMDLMDDAEFQTRTGAFKEEASSLLAAIQGVLRPPTAL